MAMVLLVNILNYYYYVHTNRRKTGSLWCRKFIIETIEKLRLYWTEFLNKTCTHLFKTCFDKLRNVCT